MYSSWKITHCFMNSYKNDFMSIFDHDSEDNDDGSVISLPQKFLELDQGDYKMYVVNGFTKIGQAITTERIKVCIERHMGYRLPSPQSLDTLSYRQASFYFFSLTLLPCYTNIPCRSMTPDFGRSSLCCCC